MENVKDYKKYVAYFQRVSTIGILTCGKNRHEALEEAEAQMRHNKPIERCFYDETDFELSDSEEWNPDFEIVSVDPSEDKKNLDYSIKANEDFVQDIARCLGKNPEDVTDEDFQKFFIDSMKEFISKGEEKYGKV